MSGTFNPQTGQYSWPQGQADTAPIGGDPNLQGEDRYNSMTPDERRQIDAWHEGTGVNPTSISTRNPQVRKLMDAAQAVYPDMDFNKYGERQNFIKGFANKGPTQIGGQFISAAHSAELLGQTVDDYLKLHNSSGGPLGYGQTTANMFKDAFGGNERASTLNSLSQNAGNAAAEINSLINRGRGGEMERQTNYEKMYQPHAAPEIQAGALSAQRDAIRKRYDELVAAARSSVGQSWLDKHPEIEKNFNEADAALKAKIDKLYNLNRGSSAPAATAQTDYSGWGFKQVK